MEHQFKVVFEHVNSRGIPMGSSTVLMTVPGQDPVIAHMTLDFLFRNLPRVKIEPVKESLKKPKKLIK